MRTFSDYTEWRKAITVRCSIELSHVESLTEVQRGSLLERLWAGKSEASETDAVGMAESLAEAIARDQRILSRVPLPTTKPQVPGPGRCGNRLAHEFTGCQIFLPPTVKRDAMWAWLASLPSDVVRANALATVAGEPGVRRLFEQVGMELMGEPMEVPISAKVPSTGICIGSDLNPVEILELAMRQFGGKCGLTTAV